MKRRIPLKMQVMSSDCGAACLASVLSAHGHWASVGEVAAEMNSGRDGVNAATLMRVARSRGLEAKAFRLTAESAAELPFGSILHWRSSHFVVLESVRRRGIMVMDPGMGRRVVPHDEFRRDYTGIALTFEPGSGFLRRPRRRSIALRRMLALLLRPSRLGRLLVFSLLMRVLALGLPVLSAELVSSVTNTSGASSFTWAVVLGVTTATLMGVSGWLRSRGLVETRCEVDRRLNIDFVQHTLSLSLADVARRNSGDLLNRLRSITTVRDMLTTWTLSSAMDGVFVLLYIVLLFLLNSVMGAVGLVIAAAQLLMVFALRTRLRTLTQESVQALAESQGVMHEVVGGLATIKSAKATRSAVAWVAGAITKEQAASRRRGRLAAVVDGVNSGLRMAGPLLVLAVGGGEVLAGRVDLATAVAASSIAMYLFEPLGTFVQTLGTVQSIPAYLERLDDLLEVPMQRDDGARIRSSPAIRCFGVTFRYDNGPAVLKNVSVTVEAGKTLAIVGPSGSGKSTLAAVMSGLFPATSGTIKWEIESLSEDPLNDSSGATIVPQDPFIFSRSIRENITFGEDIGEAEIWRVLREVCLEDEVRRMPLGLLTPCGNAGGNLSGGQRQRVALARAALRAAPVLVLDESTNQLDPGTESKVLDKVARWPGTKIVITHRMAVAARADAVVMLDAGRLVAWGTPTEVLSGGAGARGEITTAGLGGGT